MQQSALTERGAVSAAVVDRFLEAEMAAGDA